MQSKERCKNHNRQTWNGIEPLNEVSSYLYYVNDAVPDPASKLKMMRKHSLALRGETIVVRKTAG